MFEDGRIWHSGAGAGGLTLIGLAIVPVLAGLVLSLAGLSFGEYVERSSARRGVFPGDAMASNPRGVAGISGIRSSLGEARFASGVPEHGVYFNSMGASNVEVR